MAKSRATIENRFYELSQKQISNYNRLLFEIIRDSKTREKYIDVISKNEMPQSALWKYGVSGDLPIVLVKIKNINDVYMVRELIDAIRYFRLKNILIDLIVLDEEKDEKYILESIRRYIELKGVSYMLNANGGVHMLLKEKVSEQDENLFYAVADVILDAEKGFLKEQLGGDNEK